MAKLWRLHIPGGYFCGKIKRGKWMLLRVDCGVIVQEILGHYWSIVRYSSIDWLNIISLFIWSWLFRHGKIALFVTPLFEVFFSFWDIHDIWYSRYPCFMSGWWPFMSSNKYKGSRCKNHFPIPHNASPTQQLSPTQTTFVGPEIQFQIFDFQVRCGNDGSPVGS